MTHCYQAYKRECFCKADISFLNSRLGALLEMALWWADWMWISGRMTHFPLRYHFLKYDGFVWKALKEFGCDISNFLTCVKIHNSQVQVPVEMYLCWIFPLCRTAQMHPIGKQTHHLLSQTSSFSWFSYDCIQQFARCILILSFSSSLVTESGDCHLTMSCM